MDYKKIIKSRKLRLKILDLLSFIPDKLMLEVQYRIKMGRKLNLKNPKRFTEKLQWYKLNYKNPLMVQCVDKYDVREYLKDKGLQDILVDCYGVYSSVKEIDWNSLPNSFVMKDTLGGGGTSVIIVKDKSKEDIEKLKRIAAGWLKQDAHIRNGGREWPYYSGREHRVIIEEYIKSENSLEDYKFFCFYGKVVILYVMGNRVLGNGVEVAILDKGFNLLSVKRVGDELYSTYQKPANYSLMLRLAEKLSEDFPHVRVDLYNVKGKIYFGELTFFNASGYMKYEPDEFDFELGEKFDIKE